MNLTFSSIVAVVDEALANDKYRKWSLEDMTNHVANILGTTTCPKISNAVKALASSKGYKGWVSRGGRVGSIQWLEIAEASTDVATQTADLERLRTTCEAYKISLKAAGDKIDQLKTDLENAADGPQEYILEVHTTTESGEVKKTEGLFHAQFERIMSLASARKNIFLYGPTGCGKSHICEQVAKALDLPFAFVSCTSGMSEGVLGGRLLPTGEQGTFEYTISEFIKAYENGGLFLLDEIDAADPNVLLLVNAALANGQVAVSNRPEKPYAKRHPDFICIAAANTLGTGADRLYSGRNKLDAATLDRFQIGKVILGYDERVEAALCPDDDLRDTLLRYRKAIDAHRLERAMSTRFLQDAYDMVSNHGWELEDVDQAFFSGWREDEMNKVKSYNP